jgi:hypothetical protein
MCIQITVPKQNGAMSSSIPLLLLFKCNIKTLQATTITICNIQIRRLCTQNTQSNTPQFPFIPDSASTATAAAAATKQQQ